MGKKLRMTRADLQRGLALQLGVEGRRFQDLFIDEMQQLPSYELLYVLRTALCGAWDDLVSERITDCLLRAAEHAMDQKRRSRN